MFWGIQNKVHDNNTSLEGTLQHCKVSPLNRMLQRNVAVRNSERQLVQILAKTATGMRMITTYKKKKKDYLEILIKVQYTLMMFDVLNFFFSCGTFI